MNPKIAEDSVEKVGDGELQEVLQSQRRFNEEYLDGIINAMSLSLIRILLKRDCNCPTCQRQQSYNIKNKVKMDMDMDMDVKSLRRSDSCDEASDGPNDVPAPVQRGQYQDQGQHQCQYQHQPNGQYQDQGQHQCQYQHQTQYQHQPSTSTKVNTKTSTKASTKVSSSNTSTSTSTKPSTSTKVSTKASDLQYLKRTNQWLKLKINQQDQNQDQTIILNKALALV